MIKKLKKLLYESPISKDLSNLSVSGQVKPMGQCTAGPYPYYACSVGTSFIGACSPTGTTPDTSACTTGGFHTAAACNPGLNASTTCLSGSHQQF